MRRLRGLASVRARFTVACAVGLSFAPAVHAQTAQTSAAPADDAATREARALFNDGTDRAHRGDWSQAVPAFERSEALRPHAVTTYNIAYCERALGSITRARKMFARALAENAAHGGLDLPDDLATAAKGYLVELEPRVARAAITLQPEGASLQVDGRPLERATGVGRSVVFWAGTRDSGPGEAPSVAAFELELDPGAHVFVVSKAGYPDEVTSRTFEPGSETGLALDLPSPAPVTPTPAPATMTLQPRETVANAPRRVPLYVASGVGGVGLMTWAVAGGIALAQKQKVADTCSANFACTGAGSTYLARADTAADVATVGLIVGIAGVATAVVIWILSPKAVASSQAAARAGARPLTDVRIAPWASVGASGLAGSF
jgi:hypothetical protein